MVKNNYSHDLIYDWTKPVKKEDKSNLGSKSIKLIQNQNSNGNILNNNNNPNLNTVSNYNNMNTIQNTNSLGKLNINVNNDNANANNIFINNNVSTTKNIGQNMSQNILSKSNTKITKAGAVENNTKFNGYNYNYNYPINSVSAQRANLNNLSSSKLNFMELGPKTNKNESFPTL